MNSLVGQEFRVWEAGKRQRAMPHSPTLDPLLGHHRDSLSLTPDHNKLPIAGSGQSQRSNTTTLTPTHDVLPLMFTYLQHICLVFINSHRHLTTKLVFWVELKVPCMSEINPGKYPIVEMRESKPQRWAGSLLVVSQQVTKPSGFVSVSKPGLSFSVPKNVLFVH